MPDDEKKVTFDTDGPSAAVHYMDGPSLTFLPDTDVVNILDELRPRDFVPTQRPARFEVRWPEGVEATSSGTATHLYPGLATGGLNTSGSYTVNGGNITITGSSVCLDEGATTVTNLVSYETDAGLQWNVDHAMGRYTAADVQYATATGNVPWPIQVVGSDAVPPDTIVAVSGDSSWKYQSIVDFYGQKALMSKRQAFKRKIHRNMIEIVEPNHRGEDIRNRWYRPDYSNPSELTAMRLLKSLLPAREWRRYLTYGFFMVQGKSLLRYQIARGHAHVKVYSLYGRQLAELCLNPKGRVPPTDHAIMKKMMLESDEAAFWGRANVYARHNGVSAQTAFDRPMVELAA